MEDRGNMYRLLSGILFLQIISTICLLVLTLQFGSIKINSSGSVSVTGTVGVAGTVHIAR